MELVSGLKNVKQGLNRLKELSKQIEDGKT